MRVLIDNGASVPFLRERDCTCLRNRSWMRKAHTEITQRSGAPMKIRGMVKLLLRIVGTYNV